MSNPYLQVLDEIEKQAPAAAGQPGAEPIAAVSKNPYLAVLHDLDNPPAEPPAGPSTWDKVKSAAAGVGDTIARGAGGAVDALMMTPGGGATRGGIPIAPVRSAAEARARGAMLAPALEVAIPGGLAFDAAAGAAKGAMFGDESKPLVDRVLTGIADKSPTAGVVRNILTGKPVVPPAPPKEEPPVLGPEEAPPGYDKALALAQDVTGGVAQGRPEAFRQPMPQDLAVPSEVPPAAPDAISQVGMTREQKYEDPVTDMILGALGLSVPGMVRAAGRGVAAQIPEAAVKMGAHDLAPTAAEAGVLAAPDIARAGKLDNIERVVRSAVDDLAARQGKVDETGALLRSSVDDLAQRQAARDAAQVEGELSAVQARPAAAPPPSETQTLAALDMNAKLSEAGPGGPRFTRPEMPAAPVDEAAAAAREEEALAVLDATQDQRVNPTGAVTRADAPPRTTRVLNPPDAAVIAQNPMDDALETAAALHRNDPRPSLTAEMAALDDMGADGFRAAADSVEARSEANAAEAAQKAVKSREILHPEPLTEKTWDDLGRELSGGQTPKTRTPPTPVPAPVELPEGMAQTDVDHVAHRTGMTPAEVVENYKVGAAKAEADYHAKVAQAVEATKQRGQNLDMAGINRIAPEGLRPDLTAAQRAAVEDMLKSRASTEEIVNRAGYLFENRNTLAAYLKHVPPENRSLDGIRWAEAVVKAKNAGMIPEASEEGLSLLLNSSPFDMAGLNPNGKTFQGALRELMTGEAGGGTLEALGKIAALPGKPYEKGIVNPLIGEGMGFNGYVGRMLSRLGGNKNRFVRALTDMFLPPERIASGAKVKGEIARVIEASRIYEDGMRRLQAVDDSLKSLFKKAKLTEPEKDLLNLAFRTSPELWTADMENVAKKLGWSKDWNIRHLMRANENYLTGKNYLTEMPRQHSIRAPANEYQTERLNQAFGSKRAKVHEDGTVTVKRDGKRWEVVAPEEMTEQQRIVVEEIQNQVYHDPITAMEPVERPYLNTAFRESHPGEEWHHQSYRAFEDPAYRRKLTAEATDLPEDVIARMEAADRGRWTRSGDKYERVGADTSILMKRGDYTPEQTSLLQPIKDAEYNIRSSVQKQGHLALQVKLTEDLLNAGAAFESRAEALAAGAYTPVRIPYGPAWGKLGGKYMDKGLFDHVVYKMNMMDDMGKVELALAKFNNVFRLWKAVQGPASAIRDFMSNMVSLYGWGNARLTDLFTLATKDKAELRRLIDVAQKEGLFVGRSNVMEMKDGLVNALELGDGRVLKTWEKLWQWAKAETTGKNIDKSIWTKRIMAVRDASDSLTRFLAFYSQLQKTGSVQDAVRFAHHAVYGVTEMPRAMQIARRTLYPFIGYPYWATTRGAEAALRHPIKFLLSTALTGSFLGWEGRIGSKLNLWDQLVAKIEGRPYNEVVEERANLPAYTTSSMYFGKNLGHLDTGYATPVGAIKDFFDMWPPSQADQTLPVPRGMIPTHPGISSVLIALGVNPLTLSRYVNERKGESPEVLRSRQAESLLRMFAPGGQIVPTAFNLAKSIQQKDDSRGVHWTPAQTLSAGLLAARFTPVDVPRQNAMEINRYIRNADAAEKYIGFAPSEKARQQAIDDMQYWYRRFLESQQKKSERAQVKSVFE